MAGAVLDTLKALFGVESSLPPITHEPAPPLYKVIAPDAVSNGRGGHHPVGAMITVPAESVSVLKARGLIA